MLRVTHKNHHPKNSFTSKKIFLELNGYGKYDFGDGLDQFYPWVHPNNSFTSRKISLELNGYG